MTLSGPDLMAWIGLRRVRTGGVVNVADRWIDDERPVPGYLTDTLNELTGAGFVALVVDGPHGPPRRATLTGPGQARYADLLARHLSTHPPRMELDVPGPEFPATVVPQTPADHRLSGLSPLAPPGGRPGSTTTAPGLYWARDPDDGRLHALAPGDVHLAEPRGYAECLCLRKLPPEVIFEPGPSGPVCVPCVIGAAPDLRALGLLGDA